MKPIDKKPERVPSVNRPKSSGKVPFLKRIGPPLWITLGFHLLLLIVAVLFVWRIQTIPEPRIDFTPRDRQEDGGGGAVYPVTKPKQTTVFAKADMPRIAALGTTSDLVLPPDQAPALTSLSASGLSSLTGGLGGSGQGGGKGSGVGNGFGAGHGKTSGFELPAAKFFDLEAKAKRIAYVIDFSQSMKGKRQQLMRKELVKSIGQLDSMQDYQLIFFAGPVWVAGSEVRMAVDQKSAVVTDKGGAEHRWTSINVGNWEMSGRRQEAPWLRASKANIQQSVATINDTDLVFGTYWKPAIELALRMEPAPEVIYFMTDGIVSKKVYETIDELARIAKRRRTVINTISMMEPDAADAMRALATQSGGSFTQINADGTSVVSNLKQ